MTKQDTFLNALNQYRPMLYKLAAVYTDSREDHEDLQQEMIFHLWKSFDSFEQRASLGTWIYRVALNVALYHIKTGKRKIITTPLDEQPFRIAEDGSTDADEKWRLFKQQVDGLHLLDKAIVLLYCENRTHEEIGQVTGLSTSNVGTRLSRIKEKLKQQISKQL